MNIKPEQIPDEVVEAAVAAWLEHPDVGSVQSMYSGMAYALAAALPVLLEPAAWQGVDVENGYKRHYETAADFAPHLKQPWFRAKRTYTIKDTPNADQ